MSQNFRSVKEAEHNLPPKRKSQPIARVKPPGSKISFDMFIYALAFITLVISLFYAYRLTTWKTQAGGWINLLFDKHPNEPLISTNSPPGTSGLSLEAQIRNLADELGIHPRELAGAIKPLLPAATSSSIAAANPSGTVVNVFVETEPAGATAASVLEKVTGMAGMVGNDEAFLDEGF
ncbi:hypothetical protein DACRYDRAFT_118846 [Dacryopinax primogenitus]|uniref:Uncharacterized protein n=1 Tax=Dacryopinax primogenitus (strain DJM 731) TaxID=1858805 RepID=M5FR39_DACPD|nr:uncharacterized protein DACRYDRAFT_118846 [Dacryopinax primogenitus]EJT98073.1 hypothetical protein DACRYDRAFT_118846 [Dacryopinax primogenitus]